MQKYVKICVLFYNFGVVPVAKQCIDAHLRSGGVFFCATARSVVVFAGSPCSPFGHVDAALKHV